MKYKHVVLPRTGGPTVLQVVEDELPEPGTNEVRVKILAAGVSFSEVLMRHGQYPGAPPMPFTPGYDMVGVVEKRGPGVSAFEVGQTVAALTVYGGSSQYICLPEKELVPVPPGVDPAEATSLVLSYVSAYQMLHRIAQVKRGESILVHGAAGGVGIAFLQLGKLAGLHLYGTASKGKQARVSSLGATPIDYTTEDFVERIFILTGDGVDAVFDPIGGTHLNRSFQTLRKGGRLVAYGFYSVVKQGGNALLDVVSQYLRLMLWNAAPNGKKATFYSITGVKKKHPEWFREDLATLFDLLAKGQIKPIIAARFPLEDVVRAHELLENGEVQGKIVLIPNS